MSRFRLFPLVIFLLFMTFTVRLGDFVLELFSGNVVTPQSAEAVASEPVKKAVEDTGRQEIPPKSDEPPKEVEVKGLDDSLFVNEYSDEEVKVLQSLSKRREQLNQRERDLEQREKLLQAAEKKVDEKIVELDNLKKNLEELLDKQQKVQNERVMQLVKIYENMKPKDAASIFNEMQFDVLLEIIDKMSTRKVAPILAAMDPVRARDISARLAEQRALPKADAMGQ